MTGLLAAGLVAGLGAHEVAKTREVSKAHELAETREVAKTHELDKNREAAKTFKVGKADGGLRTAGFEAVRVMPLGDSITRGTGSPTKDSYRPGLAYRLLKGGMQIDYVGSQSNGTGADTEHEGHGGWTIDELSREVDGWLAAYRPDVVLLHAGTNNITKGDSAHTTARKLSGLIDQIRAARPGAYIFVAQIIRPRMPRELAQGRRYHQLIPKVVAGKNDPLITVVDQSSVSGIDLHDLRHPNDFGYAKMAFNWYQAMARVFRTSGDTGPDPHLMRSAYRCLAHKTVIDGEPRHRTECRTWTLRTTTAKINGVNRRVLAWQTLRTVRQAYLVRVDGKLEKRSRLVRKWTGPGDLLNV